MFNKRKAKRAAEQQRIKKALGTIKPVSNQITQIENAETAQAVFVHEVRRHTNKRGRVVR